MRHLAMLILSLAVLCCEQTGTDSDADALYEIGETVTDFDSCIADCKASDHMGCAPVCNSVFNPNSCSVSNPGMQ